MKLIKKYSCQICLILSIIRGAFLRFYKLGELPAGLNRDEAAIAYNGYLLAELGVDEFGKSYPLALESFGDYKLPGYIYLLAGVFKFLPENLIFQDFIVRLPSALAGIGLIVLSFYLSKLLVKQDKYAKCWSLFLALMVAITPIFFWYSRGAWEANVALFLSVWALYIVIKKYRQFEQGKKPWSIGSLILLLFVLQSAVFTYNAPLLILPFAALLMILATGWKNYKFYLPPFVIMMGVTIFSFVILMPLTAQKGGITIFNDPTLQTEYAQVYRPNFNSNLSTTLFGNKYVFYLGKMLNNMTTSFSPQFLTIEGGSHPWHQLEIGYVHIFVVQLVFFYLGFFGQLLWRVIVLLIYFYQKMKGNKISFNWQPFIILLLLPISLIPAIITTDAPHATRSLLFFFLVIVMSWQAIMYTQNKLSSLAFRSSLMQFCKKYLIIGGVILALSIEAGRYYIYYFNTFPYQQGRYLSGYKELLSNIDNKQKYLVVSGDNDYRYILTAWYSKISPQTFLNSIEKTPMVNNAGIAKGLSVTNFRFEGGSESRTNEEKIIIYNDSKQLWQITNF